MPGLTHFASPLPQVTSLAPLRQLPNKIWREAGGCGGEGQGGGFSVRGAYLSSSTTLFLFPQWQTTIPSGNTASPNMGLYRKRGEAILVCLPQPLGYLGLVGQAGGWMQPRILLGGLGEAHARRPFAQPPGTESLHLLTSPKNYSEGPTGAPPTEPGARGEAQAHPTCNLTRLDPSKDQPPPPKPHAPWLAGSSAALQETRFGGEAWKVMGGLGQKREKPSQTPPQPLHPRPPTGPASLTDFETQSTKAGCS